MESNRVPQIGVRSVACVPASRHAYTIKLSLTAARKYAAPVLIAAVFAGGCASTKKDAVSYTVPVTGGVTDISATPPPTYQSEPAASLQPLPAQPVSDNTYSTAGGASYASAASTYTVKKGDTLYKIAREHYGDAKAWHKIAAANPSVAGGMIKTGQKLILP